jgi:hypothetical protein
VSPDIVWQIEFTAPRSVALPIIGLHSHRNVVLCSLLKRLGAMFFEKLGCSTLATAANRQNLPLKTATEGNKGNEEKLEI